LTLEMFALRLESVTALVGATRVAYMAHRVAKNQ